MQSESARMSSAAEAKFRINRPNSQPRAVKVIALDARSERIVKELAQGQWQRASFLTASAFSGARKNWPGTTLFATAIATLSFCQNFARL